MNKFICINNMLTLAFALFATVIFVMVPDMAHAEAGQSLLKDVEGVLKGHLGTVVGLGVSLFGLWVWLAQQSSWGLLIVIAGAAVTAFPGIYSGLTSGFKEAFGSSGAKGTSARPNS